MKIAKNAAAASAQTKLSVCCPVYLQVVLSRWRAVWLLALPLGFAHGVPASDLVLISGSGGRSHAGRESRSGWEALWRRSVCGGESQVSGRTFFASGGVKDVEMSRRGVSTSGWQPGRGRLLRLLSRVLGHAHASAVLVAAGQPCGHVAGGQRVVLGELALSQWVVAVKLLEERQAQGKQRSQDHYGFDCFNNKVWVRLFLVSWAAYFFFYLQKKKNNLFSFHHCLIFQKYNIQSIDNVKQVQTCFLCIQYHHRRGSWLH